jgi:hypothetical protein
MPDPQKDRLPTGLPQLPNWSPPEKVLATAVILMMGLGLAGALGQVIVHDILPTFSSESRHTENAPSKNPEAAPSRGDLFSSTPVQPQKPPFYESEEFIFALKFTHIHIFGMSGIFIAVGALVIFLDASRAVRTWLIALPFVGIIVDLLSVWLKIFVDPAFFWLHIPGGTLFAAVFVIGAVWMLQQMWLRRS